MSEVFMQVPLYRFLMYCNQTELEKQVLDCGAGGKQPPLSLFYENGYQTRGIELNIDQLSKALLYAENKGQTLNIEQGDMRQLNIGDKSFNFVYSYNSIFHMKKAEVRKSVAELKRVLKPGGLLFVNFLTVNDQRCGLGKQIGNNEYEQMDDNLPVIHSYFKEDEADCLFNDMFLLYKENRTLERIFEGKKLRQGLVDYIIQKTQ
ncbi:MAG: class I SAM-dependent methyltransferase [Clostridia bacterium]|nr:class I SAM-dependent methyltransferase [Clostridia bacterium]